MSLTLFIHHGEVVCTLQVITRHDRTRRLAYIDLRVVESYRGGRTLAHFRQLVENKLENEPLIGPGERAVLKLLRGRLREPAT